jgi:hypothetical protein
MASSSSNTETRIYVGNLPPDIRSKDIEDLFYKYGKIAFIDLKNRRGPPFAFIEASVTQLIYSSSSDYNVVVFFSLKILVTRTMPFTPGTATITTATSCEWSFLAVMDFAVAVVAAITSVEEDPREEVDADLRQEGPSIECWLQV